jgi:beta-phosphoglucomutase-like phosphatase (HAD superfamily)
VEAARRLGIPARECLAFEDSVTGVRAARAAGMGVVAVSSRPVRFAGHETAPDVRLETLPELSHEWAAEVWMRRESQRAI